MQSQLKLSELEETKFSIERQFHVLKHFKRVDQEYFRYLKDDSGYSKEEITRQLNIRGSDFYEGFAPNPLVLWQNLKNKISNERIAASWEKGKCEIELRFSSSEYPDGIGEDHLLHIRDLPPGILDMIDTTNWKSLRKLTYRAEPKKTWILQVIIRKIENSPELISIFPGIYAPQLPDEERQTDLEYKRSLEFWTTHVVLKV